MKLRNIFTALAAVLAFTFVGCQEEERFLDEVKVSQSYIAIPAEGGQVEVTVTAAADWEITDIPEWLTVSPATGAAGETVVKFSAEASTATNEAILSLLCDGATQFLTALQLTEKVELPISTCAQVNAGEDGVRYRVKGTVTSIANTQYGNWYLQDETGTVYVYGTLYDGAEKQFTKHGIEVGDIVTVEGPRKDYNGTIELVNVDVISIEKSLIKVDEVSPEEAVLPIEGGEFKVTLTAKGDGVTVVVPDAAKSWLSVTGVQTSGTTAVVTFYAAPNAGGDRSTEIEFVTVSKGVEYKAITSLSQIGAIIEATAAVINAAADGDTQYRLTGYISGDKGSEYGNIYVKDATGEVYVYGVLDAEGKSKQWLTMGINAGDIVTVVGPKTSYNGAPQMKNVSVEKHIAVADKTVADFLAAAESKEVYYRLTGTVSGIKDGDLYGNFDITDESGSSVYVYGLLSGWGGEKKKFQELNIKNGDVVTLVGVRTSFGGKAQVGSAFYVSHETPEQGGDDQVTVGPFTSNITWTANKDNKSYDDGAATVNGTALDKVLKFGTASVIGTATITVPAGTKKVGLWGVAWKGKKGTLVASVGGQQIYSLDFASNDGATGNAPYTITVADSDYYEFDLASILGAALPTDTEVTLSTVDGATRVIVWGLNAYAE